MAKGSIRQLGPNSFKVAVYTGNPSRPYLYANEKTMDAAIVTRDRYLTEVGKGQHLGPTRTMEQLFAQYLATTDRLAANTHDVYSWQVARYLNPAIGKVRVQDIRATHIDAMKRGLLLQGLAAGTVTKCLTVVRSALRQAVVWGWIDENPSREVRSPVIKEKGITVPTDDQVRALSKLAAEDGDFGVYVKLATVTGCRRGEMVALQWSAVDWEGKRLSVHQRMIGLTGARDKLTPGTKTGANRTRRITLDDATIALLRTHQTAQEARITRHSGTSTPDTFLFTSDPRGRHPWELTTTSQRWRGLCERAGVVGVRLHDLRHYMATKLIRAGVPIHIVSERLGHSSPQTTWKVYFHYIEGDDGGAADVMGDVFGDG